MDDYTFRRLLERLGLSWSGYFKVRKGVKKRIIRHMQDIGCQKADDYMRALDNHDILREAESLMTVSISCFFRDQILWQIMEEEIFPDIIARKYEIIHIWSAGCALGQEVFSLKILWDMLKAKFDSLPLLHIRATDMNSEYLEMAKAGVYPTKIINYLWKASKAKYFKAIDDGRYMSVADFLKEGIIWEKHDLIKDRPPSEKYQIIFLRNNLLTYYHQGIKEQNINKIVGCLDKGGFLIIGNRESLPSQLMELSVFGGCPYIFQKN